MSLGIGTILWSLPRRCWTACGLTGGSPGLASIARRPAKRAELVRPIQSTPHLRRPLGALLPLLLAHRVRAGKDQRGYPAGVESGLRQVVDKHALRHALVLEEEGHDVDELIDRSRLDRRLLRCRCHT